LAISPESSLILVQRDFIKGDLVKRSLTSVEAAVVKDVRTEVMMEHAITKEKVNGWVGFEKLENGFALEARDRVVLDGV
jgi:ubiquitin-conjugating enzyme E2 O